MPRTTIFPDGAWHGLVTVGLERARRSDARARQLAASTAVRRQQDARAVARLIPVTNELSCEVRNRIPAAISSGAAGRPSA